MTADEIRARAGDSRSVAIDLEYRAADPANPEGDFTLTGHAAIFERLSDDLGGFKERIKRGAFRKALDANPDVILTYNHGQILARTGNGSLQLREDPRGLYVSAKVVPTTYARDLRMLMQAGVVTQMSFVFRVGKQAWRETPNADGSVSVERDVITVDALRDVSVVDQPAYPQTNAEMRAARNAEIADAVAFRLGGAIPIVDVHTPEDTIGESIGDVDLDEPRLYRPRVAAALLTYHD